MIASPSKKDSIAIEVATLNNPALSDRSVYRENYVAFLKQGAAILSEWMRDSLCLRGMDMPKLSITLGSGMGALRSEVEELARLSFKAVGLPTTSVQGHAGEFILGAHEGAAVLMQSGRLHAFEEFHQNVVGLPVRIQAHSGIRTFVMTNAVGALDPQFAIGDIVFLTGHRGAYNCASTCIGDVSPSDEVIGSSFFPVNDSYDQDLRSALLQCARRLDIPSHIGAYQYMRGPRFEEPLEIAEMSRIRADALRAGCPEHAIAVVGMSTAPEVYALAQLRTIQKFSDIRVIGISNVTNLAAGIGNSIPTHEEVQSAGPIGGKRIISILKESWRQLT